MVIMNGIELKETGRDYDFIATVENDNNFEVELVTETDSITILANDWIGILADDCGYQLLEDLSNENFEMV